MDTRRVRRRLLELALKLRGFDVAAEVRRAQRRASRTLAENLADQEARLAAMLRYAARTVPYYRRTLAESGVARGDAVDLTRLPDLEPLRRGDLRRHFEDLRAEGRGSLGRREFLNSSGGSTGEPVRFVQDREYLIKAMAARWHFFTFAADYPCRYLRLWGSERDITSDEPWRARLARWLYQERILNAFRMGPSEMASYVEAIDDHRPVLIEGYVQPLYELGRLLLATGHRVHRPRGVFAAAGTLYPDMSAVISRAFDAPVFNRYGTREVGDIACSCDQSSGLHIDTHNCYVEIADDSGSPCASGKLGRILVTTLSNYSMPLIRYEIGDLGALADPALACPCRRGLPRLLSVEGRVTAVFRKRSGGIVPAEFFIHIVGVVHNQGLVERFQVIQEAYERVKIVFVSRQPEAVLRNAGPIDEAIRKVVGPDCLVEWEPAEAIPPLPSGKYEYLVSKVDG